MLLISLIPAITLLRHNPPTKHDSPTWLLGKVGKPHIRQVGTSFRGADPPIEIQGCFLHFQGLCYDAMSAAETWLASRPEPGSWMWGEGASHSAMARRIKTIGCRRLLAGKVECARQDDASPRQRCILGPLVSWCFTRKPSARLQPLCVARAW